MAEAKDLANPQPGADWETRAYWEGCARGELVLQRCGDCGVVQHRPRGLCVSCFSDGIEHFIASGRGSVYTFTIVRQNQVPPFAQACPYVLAYVELEEGPRIMTNVVGCDPDSVTVGMVVTAEFLAGDADKDEAFAVPRFRPA